MSWRKELNDEKLPAWHFSPEDGVNMLHLSQRSVSDCPPQTESLHNEHNGGGKQEGEMEGKGRKVFFFVKVKRSCLEFRAWEEEETEVRDGGELKDGGGRGVSAGRWRNGSVPEG